MDEDNFLTPVAKKRRLRLGLGPSRSVPKGSQTTPGYRINVRKDLWATPNELTAAATTPENLHDEELKNSKSSIGVLSIVDTPPGNSKNIETPHRKAVSAELCRPYRLSLNRNIRKMMTKKRLEFYLANEARNDDEENQNQTGNEKTKPTSNSNKDCGNLSAAQVETFGDEVHTKKIDDLKDSIAKWKAGFIASITELQEKIEPRLEFSVLLAQLKIPPEMIKYLDC